MVFDGLCKKKEYIVTLERANIAKEYNIKGKPGYVYNYLEDAEISVDGMAYVVTGTVGEMWPIPEKRADAYEIIEELSQGIYKAKTKKSEQLYEYKLIPVDEQMSLEIENGSVLHVNAKANSVDHGEGDRLIRVKGEESYWVVNGRVFESTYEIVKC